MTESYATVTILKPHNHSTTTTISVLFLSRLCLHGIVAVLLAVLRAGLDHKLEVVLLIAAHKGVAHKVQLEVVCVGLGCVKLQVHRELAVKDNALDRGETVLARARNGQPPALVLAARVERRNDRRLVAVAGQLHMDLDRAAARHVLGALHLEGELNARVAVAEESHICHLRRAHAEQLVAVACFEVRQIKDGLHALGRRTLQGLLGDVRQLLEVRVCGPDGLRDHLGQLHRGEGRLQPGAAGEDVDDRLDEARHLLQDGLLVKLHLGRHADAGEVGLQQDVGLDVRVVEARRRLLLVGQAAGQLLQEAVLLLADGQVVKLDGRSDNLQQALELGGVGEGAAKDLDGGVVDVVEGGNGAEVERRERVVVLVDADALGLLQLRQRVLHQLRQVVRQVAVCRALQRVVVWIVRHAHIEEGPRQVVDGVLLVLDHARDNLCVEVVVDHVVQVRLDRQRLVEELLEKVLLRGQAHDDCHARLGPPRIAAQANHLQNVREGIVDIAVLAAVVGLRVHHHDEVRVQAQRPLHALGHDADLDGAEVEEVLHQSPLGVAHAGMVVGHAAPQQRDEHLVLDLGQHGGQLLLAAVQEAVGRAFVADLRRQLQRRHLRLPPRGHKEQDRLVRRVLLDGGERRAAHRRHAGLCVGNVEALDVQVHADRPRAQAVVEGVGGRHSQPLGNVVGVGNRRGQRHSADTFVLGGNCAHARAHNLVDRPVAGADQVQLVGDEDGHLAHVLAREPAAREHVPLLRRGDDDVAGGQQLEVGRRVAGEQHHLLAELLAKSFPPLAVTQVAQVLQRGNVDAAGLWVAREGPQHGKLGADRLAAAVGRADKDVLVRLVQRVEDLRLDRVELLEAAAVDALKGRVLQRLERQRAQIEQLRVRRELLRQQQVAEADRQLHLGADPAVRDDADKVLRRQRLGDLNEEVELVLLGAELLLEQKVLVVQQLLAIGVLDEDPEGLDLAVHSLVPLEVRGYVEDDLER
eukprot:m.207382 g.207382  ORF g.207382 m.207382 type:complete len:978 (-) comp17788_c0_seq1:3740-6673(-)